MDPVQLIILRMGLYELVELGTSPHVISEHVDLAKALVFPQAAGFTNGESMHTAALAKALAFLQGCRV
jgi:transcription termination factor NusB